MYRKLFLTLSSGTTLITANRRLAFYLQQQKQAEACACIASLDDWLRKQASIHLRHYRILDESEQSFLWQNIVRENSKAYPLLQVNATAKLAHEAWQDLQLWQKPLNELDSSNTEVRQFLEWAKAFERLMEENNFLCPVSIPFKLLKVAQAKILAKQVILVGFDELPPLYEFFFQELNIEVCYYENENSAKQIFLTSCPTVTEELYLMARWAKAMLIRSPEAQLACIVPELPKLRYSVFRIFKEVLGDSGLNFNISAGQSLIEHSFVKTTLDLLKLKATGNDWQTLSSLLNSTFLNFDLDNQLLAAETDLHLREHQQDHSLSLIEVKNALNYLKAKYPKADLSERWQNWMDQLSESPPKSLPNEWTKIFKNELTLLAWPGFGEVNEEAHTFISPLEDLLKQFSEFDLLSGKITRIAALNLLTELAARTFAQNESNESQLQILGILEAAGLNFDAAWVMGLDNRHWPAAAAPNPFIPYHQQRYWQLPHSSTKRELHYCTKLQNRLLNSANIILLSYAETDAEIKQTPSALIKDFSYHSPQQIIAQFGLGNYRSKAQLIFDKKQIEYWSDSQAPPLSSTEKTSYGSYILKEQALCPFRAFAHIRLNARSLPEPELGLSPITKGIIIHKALEVFWKKIKTQSKLMSLDETHLNQTIEQSIDEALRLQSTHTAFLNIERTRLIKLINEWLNFEKRRDYFEVVAEEASYSTKIGSLQLRLRIDRIDKLKDGSYLIIDYKSTNPSINNWFEERLIEPQLPLYASSVFTKASAIAFAQLQTGQMRLKGICSNEPQQAGLIPLEKLRYEIRATSWTELLEQWKNDLEVLVLEFSQGQAAVEPYSSNTCMQCDLQGLCRVGESI